MANINLYMDNPTAGGVDGTLVSQQTGLNPLTVSLDGTQEESKIVKCAIRCNDGYTTEGGCNISFVGDKAIKWSISETESNFASSVTISEEISTRNKIIYVKATSDDTDYSRDTSVGLRIKAKIIPVS